MLSRLVRSTGWTVAPLAFAALFLMMPGTAHAQEGATSGSVVGTVLDPSGQPVADAVVRVVSQERGGERQVLTNENGRFTVALLSPGLYTVRAMLPPSQPVEVRDVRVSVGERSRVTLELQPVAGEALTVTVGGLTEVDVSQGGVVEIVDEEQIARLPTAGRDFTDFITLSGLVSPQPGISTGGQFSIGGARTSGTYLQVDGADANNALFGENRDSSRLPFTFSLESIKEFQVITNGYDVEYGRFSGGVINAVTKGGTNEHRGNAHFFWRDEALTNDNFDGSSPSNFKSFQFGGTVSGPIVEDKLHYFVSGDFQQQDQPVFALVPSRANVAGDTINRFRNILESEYGFDTSGDVGTFDETQDEVVLFGRLDWTIDDDHRATLRLNYQDFENQNDRLSATGNEARTMAGTFNDEVLSVVGELNSILGPNVTNTLRFQYSTEDRPRPGNSRLPSVQVETSDTGGDPIDLEYGGNFFGILFANNLEEDKFQVTDNLTFSLGDHTLKLGTDNVFTSTFNKFWLNGNGFFTFDSMDDFQARNPGFFLRFVPDLENPQPPTADFDSQEWSVYLQDQWQATDRLLLTAGIRYDYQNLAEPTAPMEEPFGSILADDFGVVSDAIPNDTDNFGPRLAFTYDLAGDESQVLRGGVGLFYGRTPTVLHGNVLGQLPEPLLSVVCIAAATPEFAYENWEDGENIPSTCDPAFQPPPGETFKIGFDPFGIAIVGAPQANAWDPDAENAETLKANLGYEQRLGDRWKVGAQGIFSRTINNFNSVDLNLRPEVFRTADGRQVHADAEEFADFIPDRDAADNQQRGVNTDIDRLLFQTDNGKARAFNVKLDAQGRPLDNLRVAANYTLNVASDNGTTECCTAFALLVDEPTAGDPNFIGDFGDEERGAWGPSKTERRHVFVANGIWQLPAQFQVGLIYRAQSGNPFTPRVDGDVNGDGVDDNDRPFLPDPDNLTGIQFASAQDLDQYRALLAEESCLQEHVGKIMPRNRCNNPWFHSLDMKFTKAFDTFGGQRLDLVVDLFNVLDGLGVDAGEFVFKRNTLLTAVDYDPDANEVVYDVSESFGDEIPVGFTPLQFRAQLGVRYHF